MMEIGTKIKIFPDTNVVSYLTMLGDEGYKVRHKHDYIEIVGYKRKKMNSVEFGKLLKATRIKKGFDKDKFSAMIKVSKYTLYGWERGERIPNEYNLSVICNALDVDRSYFEV